MSEIKVCPNCHKKTKDETKHWPFGSCTHPWHDQQEKEAKSDVG